MVRKRRWQAEPAHVQDARRPRLGCSRQRAVRAVGQRKGAAPQGLTGRVVPVSQSPRGLGGGLDKSTAFARRASRQWGAYESRYDLESERALYV